MINIFTSKGRLSRLPYFLIVTVAKILCFLIYLVIIYNLPEKLQIILILLDYIVYLYVSFCAIIKRFHDLDEPGTNIFYLLIPLYNIYITFLLYFSVGSRGSNSYGLDSLLDAIYCPECGRKILVTPGKYRCKKCSTAFILTSDLVVKKYSTFQSENKL